MRYETRSLEYEGAFDLRLTWGPLARGSGRTTRLAHDELFRASRTPEGPATLHAVVKRAGPEGGRVLAEAWGEGGPWLLERLAHILGLDRPPFVVEHGGPLGELPRHARGLRLPRTHRVLEALVPTVLQQLVTGLESARAHRNLLRAFSEPAPGPGLGLSLPLSAEALRRLPPRAFLPLGVLPRHGMLLRDLGWRAARLEELASLDFAEVYARLTSLRGIGPWTAYTVLGQALGDPDAVPVGDYHVKNLVAYNLAGEPRATDERMLELLEPWRGRRGVVVRILERFGAGAPRYGPRRAVRALPGGAGGRR